MITPLDIQNKEFEKSFRGYREKEVEEFLDLIIDDYERIYRENIELKDKINLLSDQVKQYNNLEKTLKNTLVVAQTAADELTSNARHKANNIIEEAEIERDKIIAKGRDNVRDITKEYDKLKAEIFTFKDRYQSFVEAQNTSLEEFCSRIEDIDEK